MKIVSHILERLLDLPTAETRNVVVQRDVQIPMDDGTILLADLHTARNGEKCPLILIRSPYGRNNPIFSLFLARPFVERGFSVLIQSCRGTFGSGGEFVPFRNEGIDGRSTIAWIQKQPWFSGKLATFGPSYVGFVQWALAADAGPVLAAMSLQITASEFRTINYPGESFTLDAMLRWANLVHNQEKPFHKFLLARLVEKRVLAKGFAHLPLSEAPREVVGHDVPFFQDWLEHNLPNDPWWNVSDHSASVAKVTSPALFVAGFYDIFLPYQLRDYAAMVAAGQTPHLTIGPWSHTSTPVFTTSIRESLAWFRAHMLGDRSLLREAPVRIYVMGANQWRNYPTWPPPNTRTERYYLQPNKGLANRIPAASSPDHYRYDPADPTPSVGGALLSDESGPKDNRALESRRDVLTYSTPPLDHDIDVIGPLSAELFVKSSLEHTDFFVRLCDVHPSGKSINISDGIVRVSPDKPEVKSDGTLAIRIELWPTAQCFKRGHRIRLQVSSGAHPRFVRNTGSGEPLATAERLVAADQTVYHDPEHPSAIVLSILD